MKYNRHHAQTVSASSPLPTNPRPSVSSANNQHTLPLTTTRHICTHKVIATKRHERCGQSRSRSPASQQLKQFSHRHEGFNDVFQITNDSVPLLFHYT